MLIINAVLLLGIGFESKLIVVAASSTATSDSPVVTAATLSKRDVTTSGSHHGRHHDVPHSSTAATHPDSSTAGTTVNTSSGPKPSQGVPRNPHQYYEPSNQRQDPRNGPPSHNQRSNKPPTLQGGFQASPENHYPQSPQSYPAHPVQRYQNKPAGGSPHSPYPPNPDGYRHPTGNSRIGPPIRTNTFSNGGYPPFQKFKSPPPSNQYPVSFRDHSFEVLPKFRFNSGPSFNTQGSIINSRQQPKLPYGGSPPFPASKNLEANAPAFSSGPSGPAAFKTFDNRGPNYQYGGPPVGYPSNKIVHSGPLQLPSSPEVSGFVPVFENEATLFGNGFNYQAHPAAGLNFDFSKASPTSLPDGSAAFASNQGNYQSRILPLHSSSSSPIVSHYKGPNGNSFGNDEFTKAAGGYQLLANQPQLHFTRVPTKSAADRPSVVYHAKPFEEIRTDVEVINKKKPTTPRPDDSNEFDEGYKTGSGSVEYYPESGPKRSPGKAVDFDVPNSNLFNSYDEAFGKYSKLASREESIKEKVRPTVNQSSKPVYQSIEEGDRGNYRDKSGEKYLSSFVDGETANESYEDGEEQESRRTPRRDSDGSSAREKDDDDDEYETIPYKSYGEDYEKEFVESYRKELPKNDYVHVKEVPEVELPAPKSKNRSAKAASGPKSSRGATREKSRRVVQGTDGEPEEYESYTSHVYAARPASNYRDNDRRGTKTSHATTSSSESPIARGEYGEKSSRERDSARYEKKESAEAPTTKHETTRTRSPARAENDREPQNRPSANKSSRQTFSSTSRPLSLTAPTFESIESYTFPPFSSQKNGGPKFKVKDSRAEPAFAARETSSREASHDGERYFPREQASRDFSGI